MVLLAACGSHSSSKLSSVDCLADHYFDREVAGIQQAGSALIFHFQLGENNLVLDSMRVKRVLAPLMAIDSLHYRSESIHLLDEEQSDSYSVRVYGRQVGATEGFSWLLDSVPLREQIFLPGRTERVRP